MKCKREDLKYFFIKSGSSFVESSPPVPLPAAFWPPPALRPVGLLREEGVVDGDGKGDDRGLHEALPPPGRVWYGGVILSSRCGRAADGPGEKEGLGERGGV
jgi:hypothetical protein